MSDDPQADPVTGRHMDGGRRVQYTLPDRVRYDQCQRTQWHIRRGILLLCVWNNRLENSHHSELCGMVHCSFTADACDVHKYRYGIVEDQLTANYPTVILQMTKLRNQFVRTAQIAPIAQIIIISVYET